MPRSSCEPCCNPTELSRSEPSKQAAELQILCEIITEAEESQNKIELKILCDPATGDTVLLQIYYDGDGNITDKKAFNFDSTPYGGDIELLVSCICDIEISEEIGNQVEDQDGLFVSYLKFGLFGDASHGDVTINAPAFVTGNMYYDNLTITAPGTLGTSSYKVFVYDTLTIGAGAAITLPGNVGGNASGFSGGFRANNLIFGSVGGSELGGNGASGGLGAGSAGSAGNPALGCGGAGGAGGAGAVAGGAGGAGGPLTFRPIKFLTTDYVISFQALLLCGASSGGGGGSGTGTGVAQGGGGGGGGSGSGILPIFARHIVLAGSILAQGGAGGNGDVGGAAGRGGGGGGGGGGGAIFLCYETLTGAGSISVAGGAGGIAGTGGVNGSAGATGTILKYNITSQAFE